MTNGDKIEVTLPPGMTKEDLEAVLAGKKKKPAKDSALNGSTIVFKEIEIGDELLRLYRDVYRGKEQLSFRRFYDKDGVWTHGKGTTFKYEDIDEIIEGLQAMKEWAEANPQAEEG